jgi:ABC transporter substrate binding protein/Arylmalonate decarboxylase
VVAHPYAHFETDRIASYAVHFGCEVLGACGWGSAFNQIGRIPRHAALDMGRKLKREHPAADSLLLPSPHWPTAGVIEQLERELDINVMTAQQAIVWDALRRCGVNDPIPGFGRLLREVGRRLGKEVVIVHAGSEGEIDSAFARMAQLRPGALLVIGDPFFNGRREQIVALAARHAIPAIYEWREFTEAGGLMSYGTNLVEAYRQQGVYAGRILKGEKPMDLPVVQLSKFDLIINLKTANALGLTLPPGVLAITDEVIE